MYLIVGLGNPDKKYLNTFHNVGFMCVDKVAEKLNVTFDKGECRAITAHTKINGEKVILAKPITYMNLSGESVRELINKYKIEKEKFLVIYDDIDMPVGNVRIRYTGSAGTHNGMRNIVSCCNTTDINRIRLGIGRDSKFSELADFVLSTIPAETMEKLNPALDTAAEAVVAFINGTSIENVMAKYNHSVN